MLAEQPSTETVTVVGGCWPGMELPSSWVLDKHITDMAVSWVDIGQQWRQGCVLGGCWPAIETWACIGWVLGSNQDMGVCWEGAGQQSRHGRALGGC